MTKKNTIFLIICLLFCLWPAENIVAQNEIDSLYRMNIDTVNVDTVRLVPDSVPYLPLKYVHQRRYLPKGEPFRTPHAWQRLYFALSSGLYGLTDKEWQRTNVPVSVSVG